MNYNHNPAHYARDIAEETTRIKQALGFRIEALCNMLGLPKGRRDGTALRFGTHGSLAVEVRGPKVGQWFDHEAGQGGDVFALIMRETGADFKAARTMALEWLGGAVIASQRPYEPSPQPIQQNPYKAHALEIWDNSRAVTDTLAETYLQGRDLTAMPTANVARFNPAVRWKSGDNGGIAPAMIMLVRNILTGEAQSIQRRYLTDGGEKHPLFPKAKSLGATKGGAIMLTGHGIAAGDFLNVLEGFEDALACQALQIDGGGVWALAGTSGLTNFDPAPHIPAIRVIGDNDSAGRSKAQECCQRWQDAGKAAAWCVPPSENDLNAYLSAKVRGAVA